METGSQMRSMDQFSTYAATLKGYVHGQVRQVGAIAEIRNRPRHANQQPVRVSCGHDDAGVGEHPGDGL